MVGGCSESQKQGTGTQRKGGERQNEVGKQDKIPRQGEARQKVKWVDNKGERTDGEGERVGGGSGGRRQEVGGRVFGERRRERNV